MPCKYDRALPRYALLRAAEAAAIAASEQRPPAEAGRRGTGVRVRAPVTRRPPGSRAGLLPPSPLRTARAVE
jgi:hypothetical protein